MAVEDCNPERYRHVVYHREGIGAKRRTKNVARDCWRADTAGRRNPTFQSGPEIAGVVFCPRSDTDFRHLPRHGPRIFEKLRAEGVESDLQLIGLRAILNGEGLKHWEEGFDGTVGIN